MKRRKKKEKRKERNLTFKTFFTTNFKCNVVTGYFWWTKK